MRTRPLRCSHDGITSRCLSQNASRSLSGTRLILTTTLGSSSCHFHFLDEETEGQRNEICSLEVTQLGEPRWSGWAPTSSPHHPNPLPGSTGEFQSPEGADSAHCRPTANASAEAPRGLDIAPWRLVLKGPRRRATSVPSHFPMGKAGLGPLRLLPRGSRCPELMALTPFPRWCFAPFLGQKQAECGRKKESCSILGVPADRNLCV